MTKGRAVTTRSADRTDAKRIHALVAANQAEGHLLPRSLDEISAHAHRFIVAVRGRRIVGCAELAPLSAQVAEVRSLAVHKSARSLGVGSTLVGELRARAQHDGFDRLCAFTHAPGYFMRMGFSMVPHLWLTEKVHADCVKCPQFRRCGQYAMVLPLEAPLDTNDRIIPLVSRHV